jgi:hypothetical protein
MDLIGAVSTEMAFDPTLLPCWNRRMISFVVIYFDTVIPLFEVKKTNVSIIVVTL